MCRPRLRLSPDLAAALAATSLVAVTPTVEPGVFALSVTRKVGAVTIGSLTVRVEPKTPISNILWMMGYAKNPSWWSRHTTVVDTATDFVEALAEAFAVATEEATLKGLLSGYREVEEASAVLRGRLRAGDQMTRRFGLPVPVEVRYEEYDEDIAENQLLLAATLALLDTAGISTRLRTRLARIRRALADVTAPTRGAEPDWVLNRLNSRYHWALHLAELIIQHCSVEHRIGGVTIRGFVVDMWKVFEDFLVTAASEAIVRRGGRAVRPGTDSSRWHLDRDGSITIEPDLTWLDTTGRPVTVIDAKYKTLNAGNLGPNADMYQLTAYCTALHLRRGHLIYAKGEVEPRTVAIVGADITIQCHALELRLPPRELLNSIDGLIAETGYHSDCASVGGE
ncbi:restriction endonuclease [Nocardia vinacea]|uniref:McrC family protein n=1 Tax=Nocardia vinacea TaxID=96468 RepID=UPI00343DDD4E